MGNHVHLLDSQMVEQSLRILSDLVKAVMDIWPR
jgi:hypothetical protein